KLRNFTTGNSALLAELIIGRFAAELLAHLQRNTAHLGNLVDQMNRQTNRLRLICESALDRLFDPPRRVSAELAAFGGIKTLDCFHQTDVSFRNQVEQWQSEISVIVRDLDHESQIGADHERASLAIALFDLGGELNLLLRRQKRDLRDLAQVNLYSGIAIFSGHIAFLHENLWVGPTSCRLLVSRVAPDTVYVSVRQVYDVANVLSYS